VLIEVFLGKLEKSSECLVIIMRNAL